MAQNENDVKIKTICGWKKPKLVGVVTSLTKTDMRLLKMLGRCYRLHKNGTIMQLHKYEKNCCVRIDSDDLIYAGFLPGELDRVANSLLKFMHPFGLQDSLSSYLIGEICFYERDSVKWLEISMSGCFARVARSDEGWRALEAEDAPAFRDCIFGTMVDLAVNEGWASSWAWAHPEKDDTLQPWQEWAP